MIFYAFNHQNKALPFIKALEGAGYIWSARQADAEFVFSDVDIQTRATMLKGFDRRGAKVFLYPHAARPNMFNDFPGPVYKPFPRVTCQFVAALGHIEIMQAYGYPYTLEAVGWSMCPLRPFQARPNCRKVLFAPIHPNSDGSMTDTQRKINVETYKRLIPLVEARAIDLTVRHIQPLPKNGLWPVPGVTYVDGRLDLSYQQIDEADLVVSHQTFAYLAIARGTPTLMMGEDHPPMMVLKNQEIHAVSWEKYKADLMYPLDILDTQDVPALIARACNSDIDVVDWRRRLIGQAFDPKKFIESMQRYL